MDEEAILDNISVHQLWGKHGKRIEISLEYKDVRIDVEMEKKTAKSLAYDILECVKESNKEG